MLAISSYVSTFNSISSSFPGLRTIFFFRVIWQISPIIDVVLMSQFNSQRTILFLILSGSLTVGPSADSTFQPRYSRATQASKGLEQSYLTLWDCYKLYEASVIITISIPLMCFFAIETQAPVFYHSKMEFFTSWGKEGRDWVAHGHIINKRQKQRLKCQATFWYIPLLNHVTEEFSFKFHLRWKEKIKLH